MRYFWCELAIVSAFMITFACLLYTSDAADEL